VQSLGHASQSVSRGIGGFLRPFRRVGGILWLEVSGVFFLLPVVVFAPSLWREIQAYPHSSDHRTLWVTAGVAAVFLYLGVSSFWRANRRSKRA
jgi:fucose 4-O-acetylase-like acetyltransferase